MTLSNSRSIDLIIFIRQSYFCTSIHFFGIFLLFGFGLPLTFTLHGNKFLDSLVIEVHLQSLACFHRMFCSSCRSLWMAVGRCGYL